MPLLAEHPQRAVVVLCEIGDPVAPQGRNALAVEHLETDAVEAHQPVERGKPEIAVAGLQRLADARYRKAVGRAEHLMDVVRCPRQRRRDRARPPDAAGRKEQNPGCDKAAR